MIEMFDPRRKKPGGCASPLLRELCDRFREDPSELDRIGDVDLYAEIVFSGSALHDPNGPPDPGEQVEASVAGKVAQRLQRGWFTMEGLPCPQARYSASLALPKFRLWDPEDWVGMASKPHAAFWTSSFLPDGTTAWDWAESKLAKWQQRKRYRSSTRTLPSYTRSIRLEDYLRLVHAFPVQTSDGRVNVDWRGVVGSLDAVHLSAGGLLYAEGVASEVQGAPTTLSGWEAESTAWLRIPAGAVLRADARD
ncbi:hypothetical protein [Saccharopolyspora erythraea]|uniref:hypothetical protein n=1 Tax=Saccharopolyspora erythraea TaxID=1836 RepID=UPI0003191905|nr:hypothetical protein [Saccharopolyspora erythraea]